MRLQHTRTTRETDGPSPRRVDMGEYHMYRALYGPPYWMSTPHPLFMMLPPLVGHRPIIPTGVVWTATLLGAGLNPPHATSGNSTALLISYRPTHEKEMKALYSGTWGSHTPVIQNDISLSSNVAPLESRFRVWHHVIMYPFLSRSLPG